MLGGLLLGQLALRARARSTSEWSWVRRAELAVAEQVGAAVADVGDRRARRRRRRRAVSVVPMPGAARRSLREQLVDPRVGLLDALGQPLLGRAVVRQPVGERLDGDLRGDLAGLRAAHPVGDDEQRRAGEGAVLVARGAGGPCRCGRPCRRRAARSLQVGELAVADPDAVAVVQRLRARQRLLVEIGAVGRAEILDHEHLPWREIRAWREEANGSSSRISTSPRPSIAPSARS